ncbi:Cu+-exporting ATPase [Thermosporothrix hazakensis]|uniref:Cu+-exporting ATPase n=1 Tax=Thermosporothrix hazakensis TaxID=644383 RepID=A0A326U7F5_THEHA|nr:YHS domain-containing protein [Thermosporothrix hazakensis]PZW31109.1 Cu+-exporting ATPase [Thermosporothrix hazakensis]GCE50977.1 hypothetical protein KTH_58460 [Thermosporothrix hazakensis]
MAQVIDPVCGMTVDPNTARFSSEYQGKTFYFCAPGCKKTFEQNPASFLQQGETEQQGHTCTCGHCS